MALVRSLLLLSLSLLLAVAASADSDTTTFQLTGGLPFCSQCGGVSEYACSSGIGKWKSSYIVSDPVPSGSVVTQLEVTLTGSFACNNTANVIEIDVNGVPIDIHTTTSKKQCACDSCDGTVVFSSNFLPVGLPNYAYGGSNNFTLSIFAGTICLNVVNITTSWGAPVYPGTVTAMRRWTIARYSSPHVCNGVGYDNSASISLSFVDPLPPGSLLLLSTAQVFGSYWCYSTSSTPSITVYLDSTQVGTIRLTPQLNQTSVCSYDYQCNSGVWATGSPMYQTGWPNYKYGGSNTVRIDTVFYPRIGQLALYMLYYTPGDSEVKRYIMPLDQE